MNKEELENILKPFRMYFYVIIGLLVTMLVLLIIVNGDNKKTLDTSNEEVDATSSEDYDVSKFEQVDNDKLFEAIAREGYQVVYVGRESCGYCTKFIPALKQAQEEFGYTTIYHDITKVINFSTGAISDQTTYDKIVAINDYIKENYGATPMVLVFKDGSYVDGWVGYAEYSKFESFLTSAGLSKKN